MKKKLLLITGAGASIDFGMPSVKEIDSLFDNWLLGELAIIYICTPIPNKICYIIFRHLIVRDTPRLTFENVHASRV